MASSDQRDRTRCSLLIFLATQAEEDGLLEAGGKHGLFPDKLEHPSLDKYLWLGQIGTETVIASRPRRQGGRAVMGSHGRLGTAARGIELRNATGARGIIQLGMAFGVDSAKQQVGDVLVSTSLIPYDNRIVRNIKAGSTVAAERGGCLSVIPKFLTRLVNAQNTGPSRYVVDYGEAKLEPAHPALLDSFREEADREHSYNVHLGAILSGAARIHSAAFRDELVRGVPTGGEFVVGGEMKGVGLLAASVAADNPIWCVVKGISDFADEDRDKVIEGSRPIACRNAADFILSALQNGRVG